MIVASLLLILVAVMLLVFGLSGGSSTLLISSIVASLLAAVALVIGARQSAAARRNAAPEPFDADADSPANGQIFAAESAEMARSAPPADSDLRETVQLEPVPPMGASGAHDEPDPSGIRDESGYGSDPARAADSGYVAEADYAADTNYDGRTDAVRDDQPDEHAWQHAEATGLADAAAARPAYADPESRPAYAADPETRPAYAAERQDDLARALLADTAFLAHAHALTVEAQLMERLQGRSGIDPVLTPLIQELVASKDGAVAGLAMAVLAAQARFQQHWRRMELPLGELPGDLFHRALTVLREQARDSDAPAAEAAERQLRDDYQEGAGRLGLIARLVMAMGHKAPRALAIDHGGLAIFATALSMASGQERDLVVLSFSERQYARLALSLCAAGLKPKAVLEQFLYLHPDVSLPEGFEMLRADRAVALLAAAQAEAVN